MLKKLSFVTFLGFLIALIGMVTLKNQYPIGPIILLLTLIPIIGLKIANRSFKSSIPDIIFGSIDTGLLTIPALFGGFLFGVAGAIAGGIIGDALTDGIAGFFEGSIAEWLRSKGIQESREPLSTSLGKMTGCLFGSGFVLTIAYLFGMQPQFQL